MIKARMELLLAVAFAGLAMMTAIWPTWIENLTGLEPDKGGGETEWGFVAILGIVSLVTAIAARRQYRRIAAV